MPHFNYVGDSVLGAKVYLAAGVIISNLKFDREVIMVRIGNDLPSTGLRKFGAIVGDGVDVGYASRVAPLVEAMVNAVAWESYDTYPCAGRWPDIETGCGGADQNASRAPRGHFEGVRPERDERAKICEVGWDQVHDVCQLAATTPQAAPGSIGR